MVILYSIIHELIIICLSGIFYYVKEFSLENTNDTRHRTASWGPSGSLQTSWPQPSRLQAGPVALVHSMRQHIQNKKANVIDNSRYENVSFCVDFLILTFMVTGRSEAYPCYIIIGEKPRLSNHYVYVNFRKFLSQWIAPIPVRQSNQYKSIWRSK